MKKFISTSGFTKFWLDKETSHVHSLLDIDGPPALWDQINKGNTEVVIVQQNLKKKRNNTYNYTAKDTIHKVPSQKVKNKLELD